MSDIDEVVNVNEVGVEDIIEVGGGWYGLGEGGRYVWGLEMWIGDLEYDIFFEMKWLRVSFEMGSAIPVTNYAFITNPQ